MNGVARFAVCLAGGLLACGAIGCGGSLGMPSGEAGNGGTVGNGGSGGSGGSGGTSGGGPGGTAGAAEGYAWPGAIISVAPTSAVAENLIVVVEDQASPPALNGMLTFPPTTTWDPTDGAGVAVEYGCSTPGLYQIQLVSCPDQIHADRRATAAGCLVAVFSETGTTGNFIDSGGATCDIIAAKASIQLPPPVWGAPAAGGAPPDAAVGTYEFNCQGSDGTHLFLSGHFVLPVHAWTLLC